jgi:hypothetical protein
MTISSFRDSLRTSQHTWHEKGRRPKTGGLMTGLGGWDMMWCAAELFCRLGGAQNRVMLGKDPILGRVLLVTGIAGGGGLSLGA